MTDPTPEPQNSKADTPYLVLERDASGYWHERETVNARDAIAAIKAVAKPTATGAAHVAVPARSWKPVVVKTQTEIKLVIEDAS